MALISTAIWIDATPVEPIQTVSSLPVTAVWIDAQPMIIVKITGNPYPTGAIPTFVWPL